MKKPSENVLSAGKPIDLPENDRLNFRHLAKLIADGLHSMAPTEGFVVAIQGAWGSGKSSLVNFILHYLQDRPEDEQPLIARFDPWIFSGDEDLTVRFFAFLLHEITSDKNTLRYPKLKKV